MQTPIETTTTKGEKYVSEECKFGEILGVFLKEKRKKSPEQQAC